MKQIALFGGGFNPPHLAHLFTVTYLLSRHDVDEVWLLPVFKHAFNKSLQPFSERVSLLKKLFPNHERVKVCEVEAEQELSGKTFDTLEKLSVLYPDYEFSLSIGSDNLALADRWYRFEDLISRWRLIVMLRPGFDLSQSKVKLDQKHVVWPANLPAVSSSQIRQVLVNSKESLDWSKEPLSWLPSRIQKDALRLYSQSVEPTIKSYDKQGQYIKSQPSLFVWGQGRCGHALHNYFESMGFHSYGLSLRQFVDDEQWLFDPNELLSILNKALQYDIWFFACKDALVQSLCQLVYQTLKNEFQDLSSLDAKVILHCSGSRSYSVLAEFKQLNWNIGQFHPLYSFKKELSHPKEIEGLHVAISSSLSFKAQLLALAKSFGFTAIDLDTIWQGHSSGQEHAIQQQDIKEDDFAFFLSLYHCAAVFGANLSLLPFLLCEELLAQINFPATFTQKALQGLYHSALKPFPLVDFEHLNQNHQEIGTETKNSASKRFKEALTGPIARDDVETIQLHLKCLRQLEKQLEKRSPKQAETLNTMPNLELGLFSEAYLLLSWLTARSYEAKDCLTWLDSELKLSFKSLS